MFVLVSKPSSAKLPRTPFFAFFASKLVVDDHQPFVLDPFVTRKDGVTKASTVNSQDVMRSVTAVVDARDLVFMVSMETVTIDLIYSHTLSGLGDTRQSFWTTSMAALVASAMRLMVSRLLVPTAAR